MIIQKKNQDFEWSLKNYPKYIITFKINKK